MAHSRTPSRPDNHGAAPWAAFMLGIVVVLAAAAAFLFATGQILRPFQVLDVQLNRPSIPDMKMPGAPPMPRGLGR